MSTANVCLAAALAGAALFASPAWAADETAGVSPQAAATYYQRADDAACASGKCTATFPRLPKGKALQTTNVSCIAKGPLGGSPAFASLQSGSTVLSVFPLNPFTSTGADSTAVGTLSGGVFVGGGKTPSVVIVGSSQTATCTLSGRLIAD